MTPITLRSAIFPIRRATMWPSSTRVTIYLAHMLLVRTGQRVRAGELIGRVRNSGNTTEPHLHIHAELGAYPGLFSGEPPVPMRFEGRLLERNGRIRSAALPM